MLLGLRRLKESHTGAYVGKILLEVLQDFEISGDQVGVFMSDGGSENSGAVDAVLGELCPSLTDTSSRKARCLAHIINLAAKVFLYGGESDTFEIELAKLDLSPQNKDLLRQQEATWLRRGPMGKLHNIIVWIRRSSKRKEEFREIRLGDHSVDGEFYLFPVSSQSCINLLNVCKLR